MSDRTTDILFFDGDCGFCQASVDWLVERISVADLHTIAYQIPGNENRFPEIDWTRQDSGVQMLKVDGTVYSDEQAIAQCMEKIWGLRWAGFLIQLPLFRPFFHFGYGHRLSG